MNISYIRNFFSIPKINMTSDIIWNLVSTVIIGVGGIILSFIIALHFGTGSLGIFHQIFTFYLVLSLISTFGVQFSVTKYISQFSNNDNELNKIFTSAFFIVFILSLFISLFTFFTAPFFSDLYGNTNLTEGLMRIAFALPFFALNKVFASVLNGLQKMKAYAFINSLRTIFLISGLLVQIKFNYSFNYIFNIIVITEIFIFFSLIFYLKYYLSFGFVFDKYWFNKNLSFGFQSLTFSSTTELNDKLDIIVIGYLLSDKDVGIYSLISLIAKGYLQIFGTVWIVFNPVVTRLWAEKNYVELSKSVKFVRNQSYKISFLIAIVLMIFYPSILNFILDQQDFPEALMPFYILLFGVFIFSGIESFKPILVSIGHPSSQSYIMFQVFFINLFLTLPFTFYFGLVGAASSAVFSYIFYYILLLRKVRLFLPDF